MEKTAFVTGAAGFVGRHLVEELLAGSWRVHALTRSAAPAWMRDARITVCQGALEDTTALQAAMPKRLDAVFHLAGSLSMWSGDAQTLMRDNVSATQSLLNAALQRQARRVVMTSTLGVFEDGARRISETTARRPLTTRNPYLRTKLLADDLLTQASQKGLSVVSLHPAHMLGKYDTAGWISLFDDAASGKMKAAPGGRASFCHVRSAARAHVAAAIHAAPARRYVLGGEEASYLEVFADVARRVHARPVVSTVPAIVLKTAAALAQAGAFFSGKRPAITPGLARILTRDMLAGSELAQKDLGFEPVRLADMLDEDHAYWLSQR